MKIHMSGRLFLPAAVLGGVAVFAAVFFVALGVRSVAAGPDSAPAAAQTKAYVVAPTEFTASHPDVDDVYVREQYIENEGSSNVDLFGGIHLLAGSTITEVCVWGSDSSDTWDLYKGAYNGATAGSIASGQIKSCTSLSHTVDDYSKYMIGTSTDGGEGDRIYGARIEYEEPFAVGGIGQLPNVAGTGDGLARNPIIIAAVTALVAFGAGAFYARRRWSRS